MKNGLDNKRVTANYPAKITAILPAAGIGSRMNTELPKQYLRIGQKCIIEYALEALLAHPAIECVLVGLQANDAYFHTLPIEKNPRIKTYQGGASRAQTVLLGLQQAQGSDWVLVHDAARPCLQLIDLQRLIDGCLLKKQGGILAVPVKDTMKQAVVGSHCIDNTIDRQHLWHALTPQLFPYSLLLKCLTHALSDQANITDEASALEYCGHHPQLIMGQGSNLKVTHPEDLALATFYLTHLSQKGQ